MACYLNPPLKGMSLKLWYARKTGIRIAILDAISDVRKHIRDNYRSNPKGQGNKAWKRADALEKQWRQSGGFYLIDLI